VINGWPRVRLENPACRRASGKTTHVLKAAFSGAWGHDYFALTAWPAGSAVAVRLAIGLRLGYREARVHHRDSNKAEVDRYLRAEHNYLARG